MEQQLKLLPDRYNRSKLYTTIKTHKDGTIKPKLDLLNFLIGYGENNAPNKFYISYIGPGLSNSKKINLNIHPETYVTNGMYIEPKCKSAPVVKLFYTTWNSTVWQNLQHVPPSGKPKFILDNDYVYEYRWEKLDISKLHKLEDKLKQTSDGKYIIYIYLHKGDIVIFTKIVKDKNPYLYEPKFDCDLKLIRKPTKNKYTPVDEEDYKLPKL